MKKIFILFALAFLLVGFSQVFAQTRDEFNDKIKEIDIDDTKARIAMLDKAIKAYPKDADFYERRAGAKKILEEPFSEKDTYGFIADYTKAIECEPVSWRYAQRAEARASMKDYENALKDANKAIELAEKTGDKDHLFSGYHTRSNIHAFMKNNKAVIADLKKAIENSDAGTFKASMLGSIADNLASDQIADYQGALTYINLSIAEYEKAGDISTSGTMHYTRGMLKIEKLNQKEQGCADLKKALKMYRPESTGMIDMVQNAIKENGCK